MIIDRCPIGSLLYDYQVFLVADLLGAYFF
jgi:hypothetical protein